MTSIVRGILWFLLYMLLAVFPLLIGGFFHPAGTRPFVLELGVACGYVGAAVILFEFALISRVSSVSGACGQDALEQFHKQMGLAALMFVSAHVILLFSSGYSWRILNLFRDGTTSMWRWGVLAFFGLLLLIALSVFRKRLKIPYEWWQFTHALLAIFVVLAVLIHMFMIGHYSASRPMETLWALYTLDLVGLIVWYRLIRPVRLWRRPWEVIRNIPERGNAHTLVVRPVNHPGFAFEPGQFAWLNLGTTPFHLEQHPIAIGSSAEIPPGENLAFTIKALGDWSASVVPFVKPRSRVWVDGPYGVFSMDREQGPGYILIAGGIGITPFRSMCETLAARNDLRPVVLFYGCRDEQDLTFREELDSLTVNTNLAVVYILEHPNASWTGEKGLISAEVLRRHLPAQYRRFQYFICGPPPLMDAMERILPAMGVPRSLIHTERFDMV